ASRGRPGTQLLTRAPGSGGISVRRLSELRHHPVTTADDHPGSADPPVRADLWLLLPDQRGRRLPPAEAGRPHWADTGKTGGGAGTPAPGVLARHRLEVLRRHRRLRLPGPAAVRPAPGR